MKIMVFGFLLFFLTSCNNSPVEDEQLIIENRNEQEILNRIDVKNIVMENERILFELDTEPQGAFVFFEDGHFFMTPVTLNLELKEYILRIERLRYYPEELILDVNKIKATENKTIKIQLKNNMAFTKEHYLSYYSRQQADGIGKEFCRYIYDENAKLIRIDDYIHNTKNGYYDITLDDNGNIITKQFYNSSGEKNEIIEHFEYNDENQLIKSWYTGRDDIKWDCEYFYRNGILEKQISQSNNGTSVFDYIIEVKYGTKYSEYTKIITEKYFYPNSTEKEREEALESDFLPRENYIYQ